MPRKVNKKSKGKTTGGIPNGKQKRKNNKPLAFSKGDDEQDRKKLKEAANKTKAKFSTDELHIQLEECMNTFNYELAEKFCQRILLINKNDVVALETLASVHLEIGDVEKGEECLKKAVNLSPDKGHSKYLSLAQLVCGMEALDLYKKGVDILEKSISNDEMAAGTSSAEDGKVKELKEDLCGVYCAMGELYMTDLCDKEGAEQECEKVLKRALDVSHQSPEAHQSMANYLMTINRRDEAKTHMATSLSLWLPPLQALMNDEDIDDENRAINHCQLSFDNIIMSAQILIELEEYEKACEVLEVLLDEDEDVVRVWYLLGLANKLWGEEHWPNALAHLLQAERIVGRSVCDDDELISHIAKLIHELKEAGVEEGETDVKDDKISDESDLEDMTESCEMEITSS